MQRISMMGICSRCSETQGPWVWMNKKWYCERCWEIVEKEQKITTPYIKDQEQKNDKA